MLTAIVVYAIISVGLIQYAKYMERNMFKYDTTFCRDVRANLGMIAYASDIEKTRAKLNSNKSKF